MTCEECETRRRHVAESTELLRAREHANRMQPWPRRQRFTESARRQLNQALDNLSAHELICPSRE